MSEKMDLVCKLIYKKIKQSKLIFTVYVQNNYDNNIMERDI